VCRHFVQGTGTIEKQGNVGEAVRIGNGVVMAKMHRALLFFGIESGVAGEVQREQVPESA